MKRKQRSHPSLEKLFAGSLILPLLYRFALFFYQKMRDSAVGRFFCGYEKENAAVTTGCLDALRHRLDLSHRFLRPLRFAVARQFDNSTLLRQCERIGAHLAGLPLVTYGLTALFFSLFSGISFAIQYAFSVAAKNTPPAITSLIVAAALLLVGICLVASGSTLADALRNAGLHVLVRHARRAVQNKRLSNQPGNFASYSLCNKACSNAANKLGDINKVPASHHRNSSPITHSDHPH